MAYARTESQAEREQRYLRYLLDAIRMAARKPPQFGTGKDVSLDEFKRLYGDDAFYAWIGFDSDLLYTAHKAGAAMTSLYRKLGDGCQELWRAIIRDQFEVEDKEATWEYTVPTTRGPRKRTLDGRIDVLDFPESPALRRFQKDWLQSAKKRLGAKINPRGVVFEVRQGYSWLILRGTTGPDPLTSTFAFAGEVMGFDLAGLLERNSAQLREETKTILSEVLRT